MPWVAIPFAGDKGGLEEKIPCTGYPTPGIINGKTGEIISEDAYDDFDEEQIMEWINQV